MMSKRIKLTAAAVTGLLLTSAFSTARAAENAWDVEITPYIWAAGLDADVTVAGQTGDVDASFSDILDYLDTSAAFVSDAHYNSWAVRAQVDYLELSTDLPNNIGTLESSLTMSTLGVGYQFQGWMDNQTIDVLVGVRNLALDNSLEVNNVQFDGDKDVTDPIIMIQPNFNLTDKLRFNPMMSYGEGGDSNHTYELQPQFQYQAWENAAIRFGYRKLHYSFDSDNGNNSFHGNFAGPFIGIGITFGESAAPAPAAAAPKPAPAPAPVAEPPKDSDGDGVIDDNDKCPGTPAGVSVDANGCGRNVAIEVLFDNDSSTIKAESYDQLNRVAAILKEVTSMAGVIEGHTDNTGSDAYNQKLSERRAAAVSDYLVKQGVDAARIPSKGMGEAQPVSDNTTAEGRAQNRRVVLRRTDAAN